MSPEKDAHSSSDIRGCVFKTDRQEVAGVMVHIFSIPRINRRAWHVWRRNLTVFAKTWKVNFFPPFVEAFLYLLAIGVGIGTYVKEINGVPYVNFIAPGNLGNRSYELRFL